MRMGLVECHDSQVFGGIEVGEEEREVHREREAEKNREKTGHKMGTRDVE